MVITDTFDHRIIFSRKTFGKSFMLFRGPPFIGGGAAVSRPNSCEDLPQDRHWLLIVMSSIDGWRELESAQLRRPPDGGVALLTRQL